MDRLNDLKISEHFALREFECRCCRRVMLSPALLVRLEALRALWGKPVVITSGYRCPSHNQTVGGVPNSLHTKGRAADIAAERREQDAVAAMARRVGFDSMITYGARNFIHLGVK
ncbi:MAG: peptidase M15 [Synergistaceae bacterium]|nr:peptidase M15 [Synergistaceae bacterium]